MYSLKIRPELGNALRRRVLVKLGDPETEGASNSHLGRILGVDPDVIGRHTRALADAHLLEAGTRGPSGYPWHLTESGREQRALLLAQSAGAL